MFFYFLVRCARLISPHSAIQSALNSCIVSLKVCCTLCRYVVVISGKKAIHEALVMKSLDFADRPEFYFNVERNKDAKG